jgi:sec-independent protein translocase protein TatC
VFPGLKHGERKVVKILLTGGTILVVVGVSVAYFGTLPLVLPYIMQMAPEDVLTQLRMQDTIALLIKFYMAFAVAFQFPMAVLILVYLDLLSPATLKAYRRFAIVGIAFMSALFTPPEPISMIMMGLPLVLLYEVSIWISYLVARRHRKPEEAARRKKRKSRGAARGPEAQHHKTPDAAAPDRKPDSSSEPTAAKTEDSREEAD